MLLFERSTDKGEKKKHFCCYDCFGQPAKWIFFNKRQLQNYKLNNKTVSGGELHRVFTFHHVTYGGFSRVCAAADMFVGQSANALQQFS